MTDLKQRCLELADKFTEEGFLEVTALEAFALAVRREALEESAQAYERYRQSLIPKAGDWRPPQPFEDWLRQQAQLNQAQS